MLLSICKKLQEQDFWEVMDSFVLLACTSVEAFRMLLERLLACLNLSLDSEDLFCWYKQKSDFYNYGGSTSNWKPWKSVRLDLILSMRDIYINFNLSPLSKFTSRNRSMEFKDILQWNISQIIRKTIPVSTRIVLSYLINQDIPLWFWQKVNVNWDCNTIRISQWRESHCRTNISVRKNK